MDKINLINEMTSKTGVERDKTSRILECFMSTVKDVVADGGEVTLRGFGKFKNVLRKDKNFHYAPGKYKLIPEHYEVVLKYYDEVKDALKCSKH